MSKMIIEHEGVKIVADSSIVGKYPIESESIYYLPKRKGLWVARLWLAFVILNALAVYQHYVAGRIVGVFLGTMAVLLGTFLVESNYRRNAP